ncbi:MAG TPA: hypothetical protein VHB21_26110 [Minicystis sp.]|nr:hypothetical protein [Minicystis sp.]
MNAPRSHASTLARLAMLGGLAASLSLGCGGSDTQGQGGGGGGLAPATCTSSGPPRAAVFAIQGSAPEVRVLSLRDAKLVDHGLDFMLDAVPQSIAMRGDGAEAVIAYGGFGAPYGVVAVTLSPDGTSASRGKPVDLGSDLTPEGVAYVSTDRVLLTASGAKTDAVITLDRKGDAFAETTRVPAPGRFPVQLLRRAETDEAVLARVEFGVDDATSLDLLAPRADGGYVTHGASGSIAPPIVSIGVHPGGGLVYGAAADPKDPVSPTNLAPKGLLHVLAASDAGLADRPPVEMPRLAGLVAVDPRGGLLVFASPVYEIDPKNDEPTVRSYALLTMALDEDGSPGNALAPTAPFDALLLNDMQLAPSGHLVTALELFPKMQPEARSHPVEVRVQSKPGQWDVCQTLELPGASRVAFAP